MAALLPRRVDFALLTRYLRTFVFERCSSESPQKGKYRKQKTLFAAVHEERRLAELGGFTAAAAQIMRARNAFHLLTANAVLWRAGAVEECCGRASSAEGEGGRTGQRFRR